MLVLKFRQVRLVVFFTAQYIPHAQFLAVQWKESLLVGGPPAAMNTVMDPGRHPGRTWAAACQGRGAKSPAFNVAAVSGRTPLPIRSGNHTHGLVAPPVMRSVASSRRCKSQFR